MMKEAIKCTLLRRCRLYILIVIIGLFLSGVTAFPIETELRFLVQHTGGDSAIATWLTKVYHAVNYTNQSYPYLRYGTDWLAFAHLILAVLFIGPYRNPVRNIWVIEFGVISAIAIFPLAITAGGIRGIPLFWRLIDCSFGVVTLSLLLPCYRMVNKITHLKNVL
jgi:hypothetical protein